VVREEQVHGRGFTGFDACIFLLIQVEYRGFTGMGGGVSKLGAMARDMQLSCKRPTPWAPGAIPTVDFLLSHFRNSVPDNFQNPVKSHDSRDLMLICGFGQVAL